MALLAENIALRSQLALFEGQLESHNRKKPRTTIIFRRIWVLISKFNANWKSHLIVVKPETVIGWHRTAFKIYWKRKSRKTGRPHIPKDVIDIIKSIHEDNPLMSAEKIYEMLVSMNISRIPSPNSIRKYLPSIRKPPTDKQIQSWKTFLKNHGKDIWAMDYFVVPTIKFRLLYVLVIINHATRKIEHFAISSNPNLDWLKQQIRNATPFNRKPKYLLHDNDPVFVCDAFTRFLKNMDIVSKSTSYHCPWQNGIAERVNGIIRQELTNHIIPLNEVHLTHTIKDYVDNYYNTHRTHQGIGCKTPIPLQKFKPSELKQTYLLPKAVLNGLYHTYTKSA